MNADSLGTVLGALERAGARYLIVGGVAVVAHGHVRLTQDLDLVLPLDSVDEVETALDVLASEGYRPLVPVPISHFADPARRATWVRKKNATVFQLFSDRHPGLRVNLFLEAPFEFERALGEAARISLGPNAIAVASIDDLIAMKRRSDRPQDREDIEQLEALRAWAEGGDPPPPRESS